MRKDAPGSLVRTRGKFPELDSAAAREAAVKAVEADVYVASSRAGVKSRRMMLKKALGKWGQVPHPPSVEKIVRRRCRHRRGDHGPASIRGIRSA